MNVTIFCKHPPQTKDLIFNPKNPVNPDSKPFYFTVKVATAPASNAIGK